MTDFTIGQLLSGGLITNYFCTSRCRHCLYNCGPHWKKEYIDPGAAEKILGVVRSLGCRSVHIGGGEPMLRPETLGEVDSAKRAGMGVDYVETNSSWFRDPASARERLIRLLRRGLPALLVSISPFHNEFTPFSKVKGVIAAAQRAGMNIIPWVEDFIADLAGFEANKVHSLEEYGREFGADHPDYPDFLSRIRSRYWIHLGGRALETFRGASPTRSFERIIRENPRGCRRELSDTSHFHVDLFGNYIPGLCAGLAISLADLGKPLSREKHPIVTTLADSGITGLFNWAEKRWGFKPAQTDYINKCDACTEIRTFLARTRPGMFPELNPGEFYSKDR